VCQQSRRGRDTLCWHVTHQATPVYDAANTRAPEMMPEMMPEMVIIADCVYGRCQEELEGTLRAIVRLTGATPEA